MAKIIYVEDEVLLGLDMVMRLEEHGHEVEHFTCVSKAAKALAASSYDLLLTDGDLPIFDEGGKDTIAGGAELIRVVRLQVESQMPIILLTGRAEDDTSINHKEYNVHYRQKPADSNELMDLIEKLVS